MSEECSAPAASPPTLIERLQTVTEALAAANTQAAIFDIILTPALEAVGAVAGVVLLVDDTDQTLLLAASSGHGDDLKALQQDGHLGDALPASDALERQTPLFFEDYQSLTGAYPALEPRTGVRAPSASAVLPMLLDERALGVILLDFTEPHAFEADEQRFLRALAAQGSVALGRVQLARTLERQVAEARRDSELLALLGDALQRATTPEDVAAIALPRLGPALQALSMLVVRLDGERVRVPTLWGETPAGGAAAMPHAGLSLENTPLLRWVADSQHALYLDDDRLRPKTVAPFPSLAVGIEPIRLPDGALAGFLMIWRAAAQGSWRAAERGVLRRAANTLGLALERAHQAETLREKNTELEARSQALEGFALLSRDFSLEHDPVQLVARTQALILALLPDGVGTYYELHGDHWQLVSHRGAFQDPALLETLQGGVPRGSILNIERPFETRQPYYQDRFDVDTTTVAHEAFVVIRATAALPVLVGEAVYGVLVFGLYEARSWSAADRAVLETMARSLGLALERAITTRQLVQQRDALDAANRELEAFSYSVSHDLRTPVRHILGFVGLARRALEGRLDAKSAHYLDVVVQASGQLNTLIDALLHLSRTSRQPLQLTDVNLNETMTQIRRSLLPDQLARQIEWQVSSLPVVTADAGVLHGVMTQLTENALKFTRKKAVAVIRVWADDLGGAWRVSVQDNGAGFNPQYTERLFQVFQRLHGPEIEGTGVGLASVSRAIQKHGGQVFAEGRVNEGATFGFTLPKVEHVVTGGTPPRQPEASPLALARSE